MIQIYAPPAYEKEVKIENFYSDLQRTLNLTRSRDITVIIGGFKAKIGKGKYCSIAGSYGLGVRNDRRERLVEFGQERYIVMINPFLKLPKRRIYTWTLSSDNHLPIARFHLQLKKYTKKAKNVKLHIEKLESKEIISKMTKEINVSLEKKTK